ncbi:MAG: hypothetical protein WCT14_04115 [Treponemataceae bacterium]
MNTSRGKRFLVVSACAFIALISCDLWAPSVEKKGLAGNWLNLIAEGVGRAELTLTDDGTYTMYYKTISADGTYGFLSGNSSSTGTYTAADDGVLTIIIQKFCYYEGAWQQDLSSSPQTVTGTYVLDGDTLTMWIDNDADTAVDDGETTVFTRM